MENQQKMKVDGYSFPNQTLSTKETGLGGIKFYFHTTKRYGNDHKNLPLLPYLCRLLSNYGKIKNETAFCRGILFSDRLVFFFLGIAYTGFSG